MRTGTGKIAEAITCYQDEYTRVGQCDFAMANPPFNVDLVDAERLKGDLRLRFGLPRANKQKKVGNGNYLWISCFHRQVLWLQDRFPKAGFRDVQGLVKRVDREAIETADWSLTPDRYVGVAPPEGDEDFNFEQTMRDIHADLNRKAAILADRIQANFEKLGI